MPDIRHDVILRELASSMEKMIQNAYERGKQDGWQIAKERYNLEDSPYLVCGCSNTCQCYTR